MIQEHLKELEKWFGQYPGTITAFSGGVDSTLVLYLSKLFLGEKGIGCMSISPSLKRKDYAFGIQFCQDNDIRLEVIETREIEDENYFSNPANRCFFCKSYLYFDLQKVKDKYPGYAVLNGTNTDDFGDYRPGLEAARNFKILSPLADCGVNKQAVRDLASHFSLPNWNKPASPCLSSRIPYGNLITTEKLQQVEAAEGILNEYGFEDVRVRHYNEEARIEVPGKELGLLREHFSVIEAAILKLGFRSCVIDDEGLVSGKLNRVLGPQS